MKKYRISTRIVFSAALIVAFFSLNFSASAQLQVTAGSALGGWTPDSLVRNILLGEGVEVYNVQYNNSAGVISCNAIGKFTSGANDPGVGFSSGIIMCTGAASVAIGPNNSSSAGTTCSCGGHDNISSPLDDLITQSTNDEAILEFDFVPRSDSVKFRYVFASEEYLEYVNSINDVFGFFISGINPTGGVYDNTNIAVIPNTTPPQTVCINNVNNVSNSSYYRDDPAHSYIQFDGATTVLTARARVIPCATYHLKLAIADASDHILDSGVFLEANSLSSNAIEFDFVNAANPGAPSDLYEGCQAVIHMSRPTPQSTPTRVDISVEGDVSNGVDFEQIQPFFYFPADSTHYSLTISPYMDGVPEGTNNIEYAKFVLSPASGCPRSDSVEFNIIDTDPINIDIIHDSISFSTIQVQLNTVITGGMPNRTVIWRNAENGATVHTGESFIVNTYTDQTYIAIVQDGCNNLADDTVIVGARRNFAFEPNDTVICAGDPLTLTVRGADSCVWSTIDIMGNLSAFEMQSPTVNINPTETTVIQTRSYIYWNGQIWEDIDTMRIVVVQLPEISVSASVNRICEGQSVTIEASGANQYSWDGGQNFVNDNSHTYRPDTTTLFVIYGLTTGAECYGHDSILITVDTIPAIHIGDGGGVCGGEDAFLSVSTTAESFTWSSEPYDPTLAGQESNPVIQVNPQVTTVYSIYAVNGTCSNSASTTVAVEPPPVAIGEVSPRTVELGSMEAVFTDLSEYATSRRWELPDGSIDTSRVVRYVVPDDVDSLSLRLWAYNPYMCFDTVTVTVFVDHTTLWIPNAFTPDENTNNTFLVKMNDIQRYHIFIYDRRGALVFESYSPDIPWDGRGRNGEKCPQGVYTYLISCHKITYPFDQIVHKGTVVLIR